MSEEKKKGYDCYLCATPRQRGTHFIACLTCGNKRCPKGTDHRLDCTRSNEPGQPGSRFADGWEEPREIKYVDFKPKWMEGDDPGDESLRDFAGHVSSIPEDTGPVPCPSPSTCLVTACGCVQGEVERLKGALREAEEALRPFANDFRDAGDMMDEPQHTDYGNAYRAHATAAAALGEEEG